jgi:hypothetical protein
MNTIIKYTSGVPFALASCGALAADSHGIRHEIDVFFSGGVGNIVFVILLILLLLWLLLPLAVFGLKSRLRDIVRQNRETNRILSDIRRELAALSSQARIDTDDTYTEQPAKPADEERTVEAYNEIKFDP